jgi:hypothetical protein
MFFDLSKLFIQSFLPRQNQARVILHAGFFLGAPSMGAHLRVQVPLRAGHSEQSEAQLREGDRAWEGSVERKS